MRLHSARLQFDRSRGGSAVPRPTTTTGSAVFFPLGSIVHSVMSLHRSKIFRGGHATSGLHLLNKTSLPSSQYMHAYWWVGMELKFLLWLKVILINVFMYGRYPPPQSPQGYYIQNWFKRKKTQRQTLGTKRWLAFIKSWILFWKVLSGIYPVVTVNLTRFGFWMRRECPIHASLSRTSSISLEGQINGTRSMENKRATFILA